jgi:hypothetical protein
MHRKPPLDNQAPEKSGQERPEGVKSCSEIAPLGVGFWRERAGNPGPFSRGANRGEKVSGLAGGQGVRARMSVKG